MIDLYIENIQKDLTGVNITENLIILSTNIDISKDDANMFLSVCILNVKTNKQYIVSDKLTNADVINIFTQLETNFYNVFMVCYTDKDDINFLSPSEVGLLYYVKTRKLKCY